MSAPENKESIPVFGQLDRQNCWASLRAQLRQLSEERRNPPAEPKITAAADPAALAKLVDTETSVFSLVHQLRAAIEERLHPPERFEATAAPVEVRKIWAPHDRKRAGAISVAVHVAVVLLIVFPFVAHRPEAIGITETVIPLYIPSVVIELPPAPTQAGGGGGGGLQQEEPASQGELPRAAEEQFVPPTPAPPNPDPILVVEPTVIAPSLANIPRTLDLAQLLGAPDGIPGPPSAGPGVGGGISDGQGTGVGPGVGPGVGDGEGGNIGGGVFQIGGDITAPVVLFDPLPDYSEEARRVRHQGTVTLDTIVRKDGTIEIQGVLKGLGYGLDEEAIAAVSTWEFRPGMKNGQPVDVRMTVEVNFTLR